MRGLVAFARNRLGVELWPGQVDVLNRWEESGRPRAVLRLGRRSGKDVMAAVAAIHNAVMVDYSRYLRPGEQRFIVVVATREAQAREFVRTVRELLEAAPDPDVRALAGGKGLRSRLPWTAAGAADEIVFGNGVTLRALPCSSRSTRGLAASLVIFNEAAHMQSDSEGFAAFRSVWRALVPSTGQFGRDGCVMTLSTPLWPSGWFWQLCEGAASGADADTFHEHRPTWDMNPGITRASLASEFVTDPDGAAAEWGGEFVSGLGAFLDAADVYACRRERVGVLSPEKGTRYVAAIDPAFERDNFALGVAHHGGEGVVVDGVWTWHRGGFERTLDEVAEVSRRYRVPRLRTDQYSARAVIEGLEKRGVGCDALAWDAALKWQAYSRLKALIRTRSIDLPDDEALLSELVHLEARPLPSGQTRVAAAGQHHDDRASVLAALADELEGSTLSTRALEAMARAHEDRSLGLATADQETRSGWDALLSAIRGNREERAKDEEREETAARGWVRLDGSDPRAWPRSRYIGDLGGRYFGRERGSDGFVGGLPDGAGD